MAFTGKGGLGCYCLQPHSGDLVHGCAPVPCLTCTDQFQLQDNHKAGPPRGGEEWRCYTCQRVYTGRATHYGQDSKLLCELCRTSSEYDFVETSYMYHEAPTRYYGGRRGQSRQAGVRKRQPMLPLVRRPRAESRGVWVTVNKRSSRRGKVRYSVIHLSVFSFHVSVCVH